MLLEIAGAVLLWTLGSLAIAEWFALRKMEFKLSQRDVQLKALMADHARLLKLYGTEQ